MLVGAQDKTPGLQGPSCVLRPSNCYGFTELSPLQASEGHPKR